MGHRKAWGHKPALGRTLELHDFVLSAGCQHTTRRAQGHPQLSPVVTNTAHITQAGLCYLLSSRYICTSIYSAWGGDSMTRGRVRQSSPAQPLVGTTSGAAPTHSPGSSQQGDSTRETDHSYPFASGEMSTFHMPQPALKLSGFPQPACWPSTILLTHTHLHGTAASRDLAQLTEARQLHAAASSLCGEKLMLPRRTQHLAGSAAKEAALGPHAHGR